MPYKYDTTLCQDSDARGVVVRSRCCLVNSCHHVFAISGHAQNVVTICLCDQLQLVSMSYQPSIASLTVDSQTGIKFTGAGTVILEFIPAIHILKRATR